MIGNDYPKQIFDYFATEWQENSSDIILRFIVTSFMVVGLAVGVGLRDFFDKPVINIHPKIKELKLKNTRLRAINHRLLAEKRALKTRNLVLEQNAKNVTNQNRQLLLKNSNLEKKNIEIKRLNGNLKNENVKIEQRNRQLLFHKKNLKENNAKLIESNKNLKVRNRKLLTTKAELLNKNVELSKSKTQLKSRNIKLDKSNKTLISKHKKIQIQAKNYRKNFINRFTRRAKVKLASAPAKAVPFFGISVIVAMTVSEINGYCKDIEEMKKFEKDVLEINATDKNNSQKNKLCGIDVESELNLIMNKEYNESLEWISKSSDKTLDSIKKSYNETKDYFYNLLD